MNPDEFCTSDSWSPLSSASAETHLALRSITVATVGIVALAIVASWLAVSLSRFPKDWLTVPNTGLVVFVLLLTFVVHTIALDGDLLFGGQHPEALVLACEVPQREQIALDAEADDHAGGDRTQVGVMPKFLARMDVGDVHLDQRRAQLGARVPQRDRGVGQRARIEHDRFTRVGGSMDPIE